MTTNYFSYTASNGIQYIHLPTNRAVAYAIALLNTGTRDELNEEHGLAHFIEHIMFKGTKRRNSFQILNRIESVGGELDAYTTKEDTCLIASFLPQYFDRAFDLISDILFNSVFPEQQINLEKSVIIDEINSYNDSPSELIYDDFEELVFNGHPLARNILGNQISIERFNQKMIQEFCARTYNTNQIVLCTAGNINYDKSLKFFQKYFEKIPASYRNWKRKRFKKYLPSEKIIKKNTHQAHCMIGNIAYSFNHKDRLGMHVLNNILGIGSTSRLNMSLRERNGLVYYIESGYTTYSDTGVLYIYFNTEKPKLTKAIKLVKEEFKKLREIPLTSQQLKKAKQQLHGQFAFSFDNQETYTLNVAKSFLVYKKIDSFESILEELDSIKPEDIQRIACELLDENKLSVLIYE